VLATNNTGSLNLSYTDTNGTVKGNYIGIVSANALSQCWTTAQQGEISQYEQAFNTKTVIMYTIPQSTSGVTASSIAPLSLTTTVQATFADAFAPAAPFLNTATPVSISGVTMYASPRPSFV
jgi:hypothetical protein